MSVCVHRGQFFNELKARLLKKMASMRAAEERKRLSNPPPKILLSARTPAFGS